MRNAAPIMILVALLGLVALVIFGLPREEDFDHSPLGSKGLQVWLEAKGIPVVRSDPHITRAASEISLRIIPLPISKAEAAASGEDEETGDTGPGSWVRQSARYALPTLIILPKWRGGLLKDGIVRQSDLVPLAEIQDQFDEIQPLKLRLVRNGPGFTEAHSDFTPGRPWKITLYQAQTFDLASLPSYCKEFVGTPTGALVVRCENNHNVFLLSDPDLLNNHGLNLAENAAFSVPLITQLRGVGKTQPVYLDTAGEYLDRAKPEDEGRTYERTGSDLERFFAYPLSIIWGVLFVVVAICLWRGARRFGPPVKDASATIEMSKSAAIEATARLLRLSGNDGRMTAQFVQHLLADKAQLIFGSGAVNQAGIDRMFQRLARRDQAGAQALQAAAQALIEQGHVMTRSDLHRNLETFRKLLGSIELGLK